MFNENVVPKNFAAPRGKEVAQMDYVRWRKVFRYEQWNMDRGQYVLMGALYEQDQKARGKAA
jgi:hypothetical protein